MKTKKSSLSLILAMVMVLAMACGAWAATAQVTANGVSREASGDISVSGSHAFGLWASNSGDITYTDGTITTNGKNGYGAYAQTNGVITGTGDVMTSGEGARALNASYGTIIWQGNISTNGESTYGVNVGHSDVTLTGDISINGGGEVYLSAIHAEASTSTTRENLGSTVLYSGNITLNAAGVHSLLSQHIGTTLTMKNGTILVNADMTYSMYTGYGGSIYLENVTALNDGEGKYEQLLRVGPGLDVSAYTMFSASKSKLEGDVIHASTANAPATVSLVDGTEWSGAAYLAGNAGMIDIILEGSTWNVTGDSKTNAS